MEPKLFALNITIQHTVYVLARRAEDAADVLNEWDLRSELMDHAATHATLATELIPDYRGKTYPWCAHGVENENPSRTDADTCEAWLARNQKPAPPSFAALLGNGLYSTDDGFLVFVADGVVLSVHKRLHPDMGAASLSYRVACSQEGNFANEAPDVRRAALMRVAQRMIDAGVIAPSEPT